MKILFVTESFPFPPDSGGKIVSYQMLRMLSSQHSVHLVALNESMPSQQHIKQITKLGIKVDILPTKKRNPWNMPNKLRSLQSILHFKPTIIHEYFEPKLSSLIHTILVNENIDCIHIEHVSMAQYFPANKQHIWILQEQNIEYKLYQEFARFSPFFSKEQLLHAYNACALHTYELGIINKVDQVIVLSKSEKHLLQSKGISPNKILVIPPYISRKIHTVEPKKNFKELLFIGNLWWKPNIDAIHWFLEKIFPIVLKRDSEVRLTIVGEGTGVLLDCLGEISSVTLVEKPVYIDQYIKRAGAFIMPFRIGQGVRIKALTAFSCGVPIVSTSVGIRGLQAERDTEFLIAETPDDFAIKIVSILSDGAMQNKLINQAYVFIRRHHDPIAISASLLSKYGES